MWRGIVAIGLIYGSGHPSLSTVRPTFLDRPLQGFYNDVNSVARDGKVALTRLEDLPVSSYFDRFSTYVVSEMRAGVEKH